MSAGKKREDTPEFRATVLGECLRFLACNPMPVSCTGAHKAVLDNLNVREEDCHFIPAMYELVRSGIVKSNTGSSMRHDTVFTVSPDVTRFVWEEFPDDERG